MYILYIIGILVILILLITFIVFLSLKNKNNETRDKKHFENIWEPYYKEKALNMLDIITDISDIDFVAIYGTLIGILRTGSIIPWDDDIDICTDIKNYDKILSLKDVLKTYDIGITVHTKNELIKIFPLSEPKIKQYDWSWPFIDIFFYKIRNNKIELSEIGGVMNIDLIDFFPLKYKNFETTKLLVPNNAKKILDKTYKNWDSICISSSWNHRKEEPITKTVKIACDKLHGVNKKYNNFDEKAFYPVKRIIYTFWTGRNPMSQNRKDGIESLIKKTGIDVCLVTVDNLSDFILEEYPLHPSYKYLSKIHKSDYLRCYFMHHYGGGYSDIKRQTGSWVESFKTINNNDNIWMIGVGGFSPPSKAFDIAYPEEYNSEQKKWLESYHNLMVSVSFMICRPRTLFTYEWYNSLHKRLDYYYVQIKKHPAIFSRESYDRFPEKYWSDEQDPELKKLPCPTERTKYPVSWNRILGQIVYPLQAKYINHIKTGLPLPNLKNYS